MEPNQLEGRCVMNTTNFAMIAALAALCALSIAACDRLDDPPLPQTSGGLAALGAAPTASRALLAEPDPIIMRPDDDSVTTASQFFHEHGGEAEIQLSQLSYDPTDEIAVRGPVLGKRFVSLAEGQDRGDRRVDAR
jgi:hypothetical protein